MFVQCQEGKKRAIPTRKREGEILFLSHGNNPCVMLREKERERERARERERERKRRMDTKRIDVT